MVAARLVRMVQTVRMLVQVLLLLRMVRMLVQVQVLVQMVRMRLQQARKAAPPYDTLHGHLHYRQQLHPACHQLLHHSSRMQPRRSKVKLQRRWIPVESHQQRVLVLGAVLLLVLVFLLLRPA